MTTYHTRFPGGFRLGSIDSSPHANVLRPKCEMPAYADVRRVGLIVPLSVVSVERHHDKQSDRNRRQRENACLEKPCLSLRLVPRELVHALVRQALTVT